MSYDILVVDDESDIRELIADIFKDEGFTARLAKNSDEALESLAQTIPDAVILDIWLKDSPLDGLGILETIQRKYAGVPVVMISGHGNIETAINSIKMGAYDYIEKPFKEDRLVHVVKRAVETASLQKENKELRLRTSNPNVLIGDSLAIQQVRSQIEKVAPTNSRVFISGPAGSGKEIVARTIHEKSARNDGPFVVLNAISLSHDDVDKELFGTEDDKSINSPPRIVGVFERAHGGTLYIDEITDIPVASQGKLVRFLQDKSFTRVGGSEAVEVDVRVISATNKDVQQEIKRGILREDLYYRLSVVPMVAPSLSERREDIPQLADFFLKHAAELSKLPVRKLTDDAYAAMQSYEWPGNVRQLRNMIEWLLIMCPGDPDKPINSNMLPREVFETSPAAITPSVNTDIMSMTLREAREVFERQYLMAQINRFSGNISRTANFIGMERSALHRKLKTLGVTSEEEVAATA